MKKNIIILLAGCAIGLSSCKKILDTEPRQSISSDVALNSAAGIRGLLNNAYSNLTQSGLFGRDIIVQSEVLADNCRIATSNSNRFVNEANNQPRAHFDDYTTIYPIINKANLIIDYIDKVADATAAQKASIKGQALFLRALLYFTLVNEYAYNPKQIVNSFNLGVPISLKGVSTVSQIEGLPRATSAQVYDQVKADLAAAITLLDNPAGNNAKIYASKGGAQALLSRVSLYNQEYQAAIDNATAAINSGVATFVSTATVAGYQSIFNQKYSPESLFEINIDVSESNGTNSIQNIYQRLNNASNSSSGYGDVVPSNSMLAAYEAGDLRKDAELIAVNKAGEPVFWIQKYPGSGGQYGVDNIRVIRISEMYLNRAEAYARLGGAGNEDLARADVNRIRARAGLPATAATGTALIDVILKERRVELAYEGHRWFDLTRLGMNIVKDNGTLLYTDFKILPPIPIGELDINPNLVRNPGY
ncbi:RagB/SusD family nutrient uptake outer membrane protein [Mucilaginibacter sp. PAMB04274]|uniref:RagB/SusD family nutrient uptake outer membrane protein n=1 Tax=Mucilaginibacter sp. PAMB04274 TaxID=3138568 RepID=UPI0031F71F1F